jgi:hypothetical protein
MNKKTLYWIIGILVFLVLILQLYASTNPPTHHTKQCAIECTYDNFDCMGELSEDMGDWGLQIVEIKTTCMYSLRECINAC